MLDLDALLAVFPPARLRARAPKGGEGGGLGGRESELESVEEEELASSELELEESILMHELSASD